MCDCPLCPLTESNTQVCDILLRRQEKKVFSFHVPDKHNDISDIVRASLMRFSVSVLLGHKLEKTQAIGQNCDVDEPTYEFHLKRITKNAWKVCFHTKKVEADEDPT